MFLSLILYKFFLQRIFFQVKYNAISPAVHEVLSPVPVLIIRVYYQQKFSTIHATPGNCRFLSFNHTGIGRNRYFTIGKCIKASMVISGEMPGQDQHDLYFSSSIISYFFNFYFSLLICFYNGFH